VQKGVDELVTEILIPVPTGDLYGSFYKLGRRCGVSISRITLALLMSTQTGHQEGAKRIKGPDHTGSILQEEHITELRVAGGSVTAVATRFPDVEEMAFNTTANQEHFIELSQQLGKSMYAVTGDRWSTPYKLPVAQQIFFQMLTETYSRIRGE
jgi:hypothetical protein